MDTTRIHTGHAKGEVAPNTWGDFEWVKEHEKELLTQYGACVILVYEKKILGKGKTLQEATADAERNLPPDVNMATPITHFLHSRHRLHRIQEKRS